MTPKQRQEFNELLGRHENDQLFWDELPLTIKRLLLFAAGLPTSFGYTSWTWASFSDAEKAQLNRASREFIEWAEFSRNRIEAAQAQTEGAAA